MVLSVEPTGGSMGIYRCPHCNQEFRSDVAGLVRCPNCDVDVRIEGEAPLNGAPFDIMGGGWVYSYMQTIKLSLTKPAYFFEGLSRSDEFWRPLLFALINSLIVAVLVAAYQLGFQTFLAGAHLAASLEIINPLRAFSAPMAMVVVIVGMIIFVPLVTIIGLFVSSAIYHLCLMIMGAVGRPFVQTFRVVCYATGPQLFQILPIAGGMIAGIWQLVLTIIGIKIVHRTTYGKTILAVFLPLLLCCGMIILFLSAVAGSLIAGAFSSAH